MSAWMTSQRHMSYLVHGALAIGVNVPDGMSVDVGIMVDLTVENARSIKARYPQASYDPDDRTMLDAGMTDDQWNRPDYWWSGQPIPPLRDIVLLSLETEMDEVVLYKACQCYRYQSCEHDGWEESEASEFISNILEELYSRGVSERSPEYDAVPWGID